jgi:hypothetical protein
MPIFVKIHGQILDSSIADDYLLRHVFEDLLKLADSDGVVDMTHQAIAARTRVPIEIIIEKIDELMKPDYASRSFKANGARLVLLDPQQRSWGWRIVNYKHYRDKVRDEESRRRYYRGRRRRTSFVYYAVCEARVKISLASNPWAAISKLRGTCPGGVQLAAKESGDETLLRQRHQEFHGDSLGQGWFRLTGRLQDHIAAVAVGIARVAKKIAKDSQWIAKDSKIAQKDSQAFICKTETRIAKDSQWVAKDSKKGGGIERERERDINKEEPPIVPQEGDDIQTPLNFSFEEAMAWINSLFGRQKEWSGEEKQLLRKWLPIAPEDRALLSWAYTLPTNAEGWVVVDGVQLSKRKQNCLKLLREFPSEIEKWHTVRANLDGSNGVDDDPRSEEEREEELEAQRLGMREGWTVMKLEEYVAEYPHMADRKGWIVTAPFDFLDFRDQQRILERVRERKEREAKAKKQASKIS